MQSNQSLTDSPRPASGRVIRRRRTIGLIAALGLMSLAACSSSDGAADGVASVDDVGGAATSDAADNSKSDNATDTSDVEVDPQIVFAEYDECMKEHGVEVQSFSSSSGGGGAGNSVPEEGVQEFDGPPANVSQADLDAADEECGPILEQLNQGSEMSPEAEAAADDYMLAIEQCMTDKGFDVNMGGPGGNDVGDADQGGTTEETGIPEDVDFEGLQAAFGECEKEVELPEVLREQEDGAPEAEG